MRGEKDTHMKNNFPSPESDEGSPIAGVTVIALKAFKGGKHQKESTTAKAPTDGLLEISQISGEAENLKPDDKFSLGQVFVTPGVREKVCPGCVGSALKDHQCGNWGLVSKWDALANEEALKDGGRILSAHFCFGGGRFLIITEADRSKTTVLLSDES